MLVVVPLHCWTVSLRGRQETAGWLMEQHTAWSVEPGCLLRLLLSTACQEEDKVMSVGLDTRQKLPQAA